MNPFTRKLVKSQAEKDRLIQEAAKEWDELGEHSYMVAASQEDYLARIADGIEVESPAFVPPQELTKAERDNMDCELLFERMYGDRINKPTGIEAIDRLAAEQEREALQKLVAPAIRERNSFEAIVNEAIEKAVREQLAKSSPSPSIHRETIPIRSQPERETILVKVADLADEVDAGSLVARYVRAYTSGDTAGMRAVARELAAA